MSDESTPAEAPEEVTVDDVKEIFEFYQEDRPEGPEQTEEEKAATAEEMKKIEEETGPPIKVGEIEIPPAPGQSWNEEAVNIISTAAAEYGVPSKNIQKAFEWYATGGMRKIAFERGEGISVMEHLYKEAAPALIELARSKVALLDSPDLNKLLTDTDLGSDPFLIATLANLAIPSKRVEVPPEVDPESPYWNPRDHRHPEAVRRAKALYSIIYGKEGK
jgi:hypothetical protein